MNKKYIAQDPLDNIFSEEGGIFEGTLIMCAGQPGVGKTTLMLNYLSKINKNPDTKVVYVSSEMSQLDNEHIYNYNEDIKNIKTIYLTKDCLVELKSAIDYNDVIFIDSINSIVEKIAYFHDMSHQKAEQVVLNFLENNQKNKTIIFSQKINKDGSFKGSSHFGHLTTTNIMLTHEEPYRKISVVKNRRGSNKELFFKIEKGEIKYNKETPIDDKLKKIHENLI